MVIIRPARSHGGCRNLEDEPALTISTEMQKISTREVDRKVTKKTRNLMVHL